MTDEPHAMKPSGRDPSLTSGTPASYSRSFRWIRHRTILSIVAVAATLATYLLVSQTRALTGQTGATRELGDPAQTGNADGTNSGGIRPTMTNSRPPEPPGGSTSRAKRGVSTAEGVAGRGLLNSMLGGGSNAQHYQEVEFCVDIGQVPEGGTGPALHFRLNPESVAATFSEGFAQLQQAEVSEIVVRFQPHEPLVLGKGLWRVRVPVDASIAGWVLVDGSFSNAFPMDNTAVSVLEVIDAPFTMAYWSLGYHTSGDVEHRTIASSLNRRCSIEIDILGPVLTPSDFTVSYRNTGGPTEIVLPPTVMCMTGSSVMLLLVGEFHGSAPAELMVTLTAKGKSVTFPWKWT